MHSGPCGTTRKAIISPLACLNRNGSANGCASMTRARTAHIRAAQALTGRSMKAHTNGAITLRSEERRVGKECVVRVDLGGRRIIKKKKTKQKLAKYKQIMNSKTIQLYKHRINTSLTKGKR